MELSARAMSLFQNNTDALTYHGMCVRQQLYLRNEKEEE